MGYYVKKWWNLGGVLMTSPKPNSMEAEFNHHVFAVYNYFRLNGVPKYHARNILQNQLLSILDQSELAFEKYRENYKRATRHDKDNFRKKSKNEN